MQVQAGSAMRVSGTIVRMIALPAEAEQKITVKLHSFIALQKDYVLLTIKTQLSYVAKCSTFVAIIK